MLQSADTAANRARTRHNFRKHVQGRFDADFEVPHHRVRNCNGAQQQPSYAVISAALPGKLKRGWNNGTVSRHAKKRFPEALYGSLGQEDQDTKSEPVQAWLNATPTNVDSPALDECDTVLLQLAGQKQNRADKIRGDGGIGRQTQVSGTGVEIQCFGDGSKAIDGHDEGVTGSRTFCNNPPEVQYQCHVACDDLAQQCLGK